MATPVTAALGLASSVASAAAPLMQAKTPGMNLDKIKALAGEFESVFLNNMLEEMVAGVGEDDPFGNSEGAATWRSLQTEEFGRAISRAGGIGLAEHVERHLIALQESQS
jgi:Rod binding domain-containing protein